MAVTIKLLMLVRKTAFTWKISVWWTGKASPLHAPGLGDKGLAACGRDL